MKLTEGCRLIGDMFVQRNVDPIHNEDNSERQDTKHIAGRNSKYPTDARGQKLW